MVDDQARYFHIHIFTIEYILPPDKYHSAWLVSATIYHPELSSGSQPYNEGAMRHEVDGTGPGSTWSLSAAPLLTTCVQATPASSRNWRGGRIVSSTDTTLAGTAAEAARGTGHSPAAQICHSHPVIMDITIYLFILIYYLFIYHHGSICGEYSGYHFEQELSS